MTLSSRKVVVWGAGNMGTQHLNVLKKIEGVEPLALSRRKERLIELKQAGFTTVDDIVFAAKAGATLAIIATDTGYHVEDGLAAIECNFDLLVEKPIAVSAEAALPLYKKAKEKNRQIFVGCVLRFSESLYLFREMLSQIGAVYTVRIECQSYLPDWRPRRPYSLSYSARSDEGGVLRDLIHEIDYATWMFGWPKKVQGRLRNLGKLGIGAEETADLSWVTTDDVLISISLDYLSRISRRRLRAHGELGVLEWDGITGQVILELPGRKPQLVTSSQKRDEIFLGQAKAFLGLSAIKERSRLAMVEEGLKALSICDAARKSSQTQREETVSYYV